MQRVSVCVFLQSGLGQGLASGVVPDGVAIPGVSDQGSGLRSR